jgi:hypothetical protein
LFAGALLNDMGNPVPNGRDAVVITATEVMPLFVAASPSFAFTWESVEIENADEASPAGRLRYLDAGGFIRHLVGLRLAGRTEEFPAVFDVIERLVCEGDDYVRKLAVIGYLEGMEMMTVTVAGLDPETDFRPYCRHASEAWWERLNRFWEGDATALRDPDGAP